MNVFPPDLYQRIRLFLALGSNGQIILNVSQGHILSYQITEHRRVCDDKTLDTDVVQPVA